MWLVCLCVFFFGLAVWIAHLHAELWALDQKIREEARASRMALENFTEEFIRKEELLLILEAHRPLSEFQEFQDKIRNGEE